MNLKKNIRKILKEEFDDLDWIRDVEVDPLNSGTLMFISPLNTNAVKWLHKQNSTKEYIVLKITNVTDDKVDFEVLVDTMDSGRIGSIPLDHANKLINTGYWRILSSTTPQEYITPGNNSYNDKVKSEDFLPYIIFDGEKMKLNQLKESDDLDWIRTTDPKDTEPRKGDKIRVHNLGTKESFLNWLSVYGTNYTDGDYGPFIEGEVIEYKGENFCLREMNTGDPIYFPSYKHIPTLNNKGHKGLDFLYEFI